MSPLYITRNILLGGAAGYFAYWSYTKVILPRVNATFRPETVSGSESRIEVLATPLVIQEPISAMTSPAPTSMPLVDELKEVAGVTPDTIPSDARSLESSPLTPPAFALRKSDPWWLPWLPIQQILVVAGLSPWPFDYSKGTQPERSTKELTTGSAHTVPGNAS